MDITAELKAWDQRWDASPNGVAHQELMGIAARSAAEIERLEGVAAERVSVEVDALRGAFKGRPVDLKQSLRQEAATAGTTAQAGAGGAEWCEGMRILALQFTAAADEIERLEKELAEATGANRV